MKGKLDQMFILYFNLQIIPFGTIYEVHAPPNVVTYLGELKNMV
jgi:hypothetical protein